MNVLTYLFPNSMQSKKHYFVFVQDHKEEDPTFNYKKGSFYENCVKYPWNSYAKSRKQLLCWHKSNMDIYVKLFHLEIASILRYGIW